ncbi:MAG TPA: 2-dehydro-3-deoxy-6-phosphogalactonate aldolase [Hyphomicrobiaceae bacterium]|nr:2-dehydro-3-deoxy-6-phosphogalactonate aldolase [Hyphomicrobiaceae bacterium]
MNLADALRQCPLIAILRGIRPDEAEPVGDVLVEAGFRVIEVPFNSPEPLRSIERLARRLDKRAVIGAGTVMSIDDVEKVAAAGGRLIVMPHTDLDVVEAARDAGLAVTPGVATPTEAIAAIAAGVDGLKLFPAEMMLPPVVKALRAVLPKEVILIPVGGISAANIPAYRAAGADAFGIGSTLYSPGKALADIRASAVALVKACRV